MCTCVRAHACGCVFNPLFDLLHRSFKLAMVRKPGKNTGFACFLFLALAFAIGIPWLAIATGKPIQASADGMADDAPKGVGQTATEAHGALKSDVADINATGIEGEPHFTNGFSFPSFFFSPPFSSEMLSLCLLLTSAQPIITLCGQRCRPRRCMRNRSAMRAQCTLAFPLQKVMSEIATPPQPSLLSQTPPHHSSECRWD